MLHGLSIPISLLILLILSSCLNKEETLEDKANKIDKLDKEWASRKLRKEEKIDLYKGPRESYDTVYVFKYFDKDNHQRYHINCPIADSVVEIFFVKDEVSLKRTSYQEGRDSFLLHHFIEPQWLERRTGNMLNPDTVLFLSSQEKALFKRILNL